MPKAKKVRHVIPISGKDSLCTAIVQMRRAPKLPYEFVFCDVGMELPETYEWINKVEKSLGIEIKRVGKSLEQVIANAGMLPSFARRFCTKLAKIEPLKEFMDVDNWDEVVRYGGFRADEKNRIPPEHLDTECTTVYPLIEEGIDLPGVYKILNEQNILPPSFFWTRLYDAVYSTVGSSSQKFIDSAPAWTTSFLFSWRSRANCYSCFFQRLYEWVGLLEYHPDLFDQANEIEKTFGYKGSDFRIYKQGEEITQCQNFYWNPNYSLEQLKKDQARIFQNRVNQVRKDVVEARHRGVDGWDRMAATSCGALCGK